MALFDILARPLILGISALSLIAATASHAEEAHAMHETHWSYEGEGAPEHWGDLKPDFATCKSGASQSPIDVSSKVKAKQHDIAFAYSGEASEIVNNGHTIQVNVAPGSAITVGGKRYELLQFHFHSPSEHTINGKHSPMVIHFVHKSDDGKLGVIGVLVNLGKENSALASLWAKLPQAAGEKVALENKKVDLMQLLPKGKTYYSYVGSLTTPPCTEGVQWMVMSSTISASKKQVEAFTKLFPHNNRPVQPLNNRTVSGG